MFEIVLSGIAGLLVGYLVGRRAEPAPVRIRMFVEGYQPAPGPRPPLPTTGSGVRPAGQP